MTKLRARPEGMTHLGAQPEDDPPGSLVGMDDPPGSSVGGDVPPRSSIKEDDMSMNGQESSGIEGVRAGGLNQLLMVDLGCQLWTEVASV